MDKRIMAANFDAVRRKSGHGAEYWTARELQPHLGYASWRNFSDVIRKAIMACEGAGALPEDHFVESGKMVDLGSDAKREIKDYALSRYACYLIAMNGDPAHPRISAAQHYFAVQTRKQELSGAGSLEKRAALRERVREANKGLNAAAQEAGVIRYAVFHDAGYRGLYGMGLPAVKRRKGIGKDDLLDRAGRAELAMNEFRITQTEQALTREGVRGEVKANARHRQIGGEVRDTIRRIGGTLPENLPAEPSLRKLRGRERAPLAGKSG